jgi:hypothetical protein
LFTRSLVSSFLQFGLRRIGKSELLRWLTTLSRAWWLKLKELDTMSVW